MVDALRPPRRVSFLDTCQVIPLPPSDSPPLPPIPLPSSPTSPTSPTSPLGRGGRGKHLLNPFHKLRRGSRRSHHDADDDEVEPDPRLVLPSTYVREQQSSALVASPPPTQTSSAAAHTATSRSQPSTTAQSGERLRRKLISPPPPILRTATPVGIRQDDEQETAEETEEKKGAKTGGGGESSSITGRSVPESQAAPSLDSSALGPDRDGAPSASPPPTMTRPVAVRKALSLGPPLRADDDDDGENEGDESERTAKPGTATEIRGPETRPAAALRRESSSPGHHEVRVPPVVSSSGKEGPLFPPLARRFSPPDQGEGEAAWEDEGEGHWEEEALHKSCICPNCEQLMLKSLAKNYVPPWTRSARKKYLADRQQAQQLADNKSSSALRGIYSHKLGRYRSNSSTDDVTLISNTNANSSVLSPSQSPFLPDWLREGVVDDNEDEIKPKELKADEVDHKRGIRKVAMMQTRIEAPSCPASGMRSPSTPVLDDTVLAEEVDMELRRRREQEKATKDRMDKRTLSNDTNALRGGGARAMMRQLEEAEKKERRADLQRRRSSETHIHRPKVSSPPSKEPEPVSVQMGAVKDVPTKPFTPPPRLNSPDVMVSQPPIKRTQSPLEALRARSPFKRTDSSNSNEGRSTPPAVENATSSSPHSSSPLKKSAPLPAESRPAAEVAKATSGAAIEKTVSTSDQPSLLIRRELSLGIPLHNARSGSGSPSLQIPQAGGTGSSRASSSHSRSQSPLKPSSTTAPNGLGSLQEGKEAVETPSDSSSSLVKDSGSLRQPHARSHASLPRYGSPLGGAEPSLGMRPDPAKVSRRHSAFVGNGNGTVPGTSSPLASSGRHSDEVDRRGAASSSSGLHTVKAPQISEEAAARRERERGDSKLGRAKTWGHSLFGKMRP